MQKDIQPIHPTIYKKGDPLPYPLATTDLSKALNMSKGGFLAWLREHKNIKETYQCLHEREGMGR